MQVSNPPVALNDEEIVHRVKNGDTALFEVLMRRYNQRIYRVARAVTSDDTEAEDVMQQAYVNAYTHLSQFEERAQFSTWLTRIAVHEALARRRRKRATEPLGTDEDYMQAIAATGPDPEQQAYAGELRQLLETTVDQLPESYRMVFMLRAVEGMSTAETAETLELGEEAVKTRFHRARAMLRRDLFDRAGAASARAFDFHLSRCDRVVAAVMARIR